MPCSKNYVDVNVQGTKILGYRLQGHVKEYKSEGSKSCIDIKTLFYDSS